MAKMLTESEIENLLVEIASSGSNEDKKENSNQRRIKIYDFRRPDVFSKDEIRKIANFSDMLSNKVNIALSNKEVNVKTHIASVDQLKFEEFIRSVPTPTELTTLGWDKHTAVLEVDPYVSMSLLGILPIGSKVAGTNRDFAEVEIKRWRKEYVSKIVNAIKTVSKSKVKDLQFFNNPQHLDALDHDDMICLLTFEVKVEDNTGASTEGLMNLVLSKEVGKQIANGKGDKKKMSKDSIDMVNINETSLKVDGVLGSTTKTINEISKIKKGEIIKLDKIAGEPVDVTINGKVVAKAEVVIDNENFALRIVDIV